MGICQSNFYTYLMYVGQSCRGFLFLPFLYLASPAVVADELVFFGVEDGLPQSSVNDITQDRHGFIWFATNDGIARFDGSQFRNYELVIGSQRRIQQVRSLHAAPDGFLYALAESQLFYHDPASDTFRSVLLNNSQKSPAQRRVTSHFHRNSLLSVLPGSSQTLRKEMLAEGRVISIDHIELPENFSAEELIPGSSDGMYVASEASLLFFSSEHDGVLPVNLPADIKGTLRVERTETGDILLIGMVSRWCLSADSVSECGNHNLNNSEIPEAPESTKPIFIQSYRDGQKLMPVFGQGLFLLAEDYSLLQHFSDSRQSRNRLPNNNIHKTFVDQAGNIWLSTFGAGVVMRPFARQTVSTINASADNNALTHPHVRTLFQQGDYLWVGTFNGLNQIDLRDNSIKHYLLPSPAGVEQFVRGVIPVGEKLMIMLSRQIEGSAIWLLEPDNASWERFSVPRDVPAGDGVFTAVQGRGAIWVSFTFSGLFAFDFATGQWLKPALWSGQQQPSHIQALYFDRKSNLWMGHMNGLSYYDFSIGELRNLSENAKNGVSDNWVRSFYEAADGSFWAGTNGGLNALRVVSSQPSVSEQLFKDDTIYGIVEDERQNLWMSTNRGLMAFNTQTRQLRRFDISDGLQNNEFNTGAYLRLSDGKLAFGGVSGLNVFSPAELLINQPVLAPLNIVALRLQNETVDFSEPVEGLRPDAPAPDLSALEIKQSGQSVSLELALAKYTERTNTRYEYRNPGLSEEWQIINGNRVFLNGLPVGNYLIGFRAVSATGVVLGERSLNLSVVPPLWRSSSAIFIYVIAVAVLIMFFYHRRTVKHRRQTRYLQQAVAERTKELNTALSEKNAIFNHISHEFRTPLTLINGLAGELSAANPHSSSTVMAIKRQNARLLSLVNRLITLNSQQGGELKVYPCELRDILVPVIEVFSVLAKQKGISITLETEDELWCMTTRHDMETVLNNLLSNAIKYSSGACGDESCINVEARKVGQSVICRVTDSGPGIADGDLTKIWRPFYRSEKHKAVEGTGLGLPLVRNLILRMHGEIRVFNLPEKGCCFEFILPLCAEAQQRAHSVDAQHPGENAGVQMSDVKPECPLPLPATSEELTSVMTQRQQSGDYSKKPCVLVVEDNRELAEYLRRVLCEQYHVELATDGIAALDCLEQRLPDIIISDVMMPKMDGFTLCDKLKSEAATSHIPVILLTARNDIASRIGGLELQADLYLGKPFEPEELLLHVRNLMTRLQTLKLYYQAGFRRDYGLESDVHVSEKKFSDKLDQAIDEYFSDPDFDPPRLAEILAMSERQLQRKLKALADCTPSQFIRYRRLEKSKSMLLAGKPVGNVAFDCGFSSQAYFTKCFREYFKVTPSAFVRDVSEMSK